MGRPAAGPAHLRGSADGGRPGEHDDGGEANGHGTDGRSAGHVDRSAAEVDTCSGAPALSSTLDRLADRYDVVVVGSGYGGAIAAARLPERAGGCACSSGAARSTPGDFPNTPVHGRAASSSGAAGRAATGARTGLFDLRAGHDLSVLVGCGLGGTSLINAGVALRPPGVGLRRRPLAGRAARHDGQPRARRPTSRGPSSMLGVRPYPERLADACPSSPRWA